MYKRREDESLNAYQVRLSLMKLTESADLDWEDIKELLESNKHRDTLRREGYGIQIREEVLQEEKSKLKESGSSAFREEIEKLNEKILEEREERLRLTDLRTLVNKKIREYNRIKSMENILSEKIEDMELPKTVEYNFKDSEKIEKEGILMLSDWHYGEGVDIFLNQYNPTIAKERVDYLIDKTIEHCRTHGIQILNVFSLGDIISGENYSTIRLENRENLIEQILNASDVLAQAVSKLSLHIPCIKFAMCTGNHERSIESKKEALNKDNYTDIIKKFVKLRLQNIDNIEFIENKYDNEMINMNILGLNVVGLHGDKVRKNQEAYQLSSLIGDNVNIVCLGHWHEVGEETNFRAMIYRNGSLVGSNEYSRNLNLHAIPTQKLLILNKYGCECSYNIRLNIK